MSPARRWAALAVLNLAVLLVAVDATVLNLAIPQITVALAPSGTELLWILDVYALVLAGLLVSAGSLADRLGRRRVLLVGCTVFGAASVLAAFATSPEMLIAARVLLAVGGATIMPSTLALIRTIFTDARRRTLAIGLWSAMAAGGAAVGPILGGVLLERFWWGSVFLINVPVMVLLLVAGPLVLPEARAAATGRWDAAGAAASIAGLIALVYALKNAAAYGAVPDVLVTAVVAVAALTWFVRRQTRTAHPLIDVSLFRRRPFTGAVLGNLFAMLALSGLLLFVSQYLQLVLGHPPLAAGMRLLPLTVGALLGAPLTARLVARAGPRATIATGLAAGALGMLGFASALNQAYPVVAGALLLVGTGVGVAVTATSELIVTSAPADRAGAASSISETAYELGTGLGVALLGTLLAGLYRGALPPEVAAGPGRESLASAAQAAAELPAADGAGVLDAARAAFLDALQGTGLVSAALLATAAALVLALRDRAPAGPAAVPGPAR